MKKFKLKKGDNVIVISGKDKGKSGEIIEVLKSLDKVKVRGVNIAKKHRKPTQESPGKIDEIELITEWEAVVWVIPESEYFSWPKKLLKFEKSMRSGPGSCIPPNGSDR